MARAYADYLNRGVTIAGIVIDSPAQNAAMVAKLGLPFPILSDPDGSKAIKPLNLWDGPGKMSIPAIVIFSPVGDEVYRYTGTDFMDRPDDTDVLSALDRLGLPSLDQPVSTIAHMTPKAGGRAIPLADLAIYMRGVRWASQGLADRARDPHDRAEGERTSRMAERFIAAQAATRRYLGSD